ncbi:hypothetical protein [Jiella marina]|uniref:hypothetical protein n=1 Tax=Jiella sp. LLJ827 TaxID=2917712 RepID=UPI002100AE5D|nr:hypothetical protein [Jiella sp. LLJ827]MCQ0990603.1 hypothetical protein [Jiella sp. LLJ827]
MVKPDEVPPLSPVFARNAKNPEEEYKYQREKELKAQDDEIRKLTERIGPAATDAANKTQETLARLYNVRVEREVDETEADRRQNEIDRLIEEARHNPAPGKSTSPLTAPVFDDITQKADALIEVQNERMRQQIADEIEEQRRRVLLDALYDLDGPNGPGQDKKPGQDPEDDPTDDL